MPNLIKYLSVLIKNPKTYYFILGSFSTLLIFFLLYSLFVTDNSLIANSDSQFDFPQEYKIISPEIPDDLYFAGEKVPLDNFEIYERIDREFMVNTYWHSSMLLALKRANRWFPVIEPILKKYNVPDDFKYLAVAESNLDNVVSPAGATGFWQFMKAAAEKYGLEVNKEIDERYHVEKSTEAACKYLKDSFEMFGSWTLAAASYNMGTNGVTNQTSRQKTNNYYNLVLNTETSRFVARIVSLKYIMSSPKKYGFELKNSELYPEFKTYNVDVPGPVSDFADYAISSGLNYKILKMYNPWLRESYLTNKSGKTYSLKLPEKGSIEVIKE